MLSFCYELLGSGYIISERTRSPSLLAAETGLANNIFCILTTCDFRRTHQKKKNATRNPTGNPSATSARVQWTLSPSLSPLPVSVFVYYLFISISYLQLYMSSFSLSSNFFLLLCSFGGCGTDTSPRSSARPPYTGPPYATS